jgi:peptide/nickel transport system permease protein
MLKPRTYLPSRFLRRLLWKRKTAGMGAFIILVIVVCAVAAPLLAPEGPTVQNLRERYEPPSPSHWLGTDNFGRDIFARIVWGSRISLVVGTVTVAIAMLLGGLLGILGGYAGGIIDRVLNAVVEMLMAFPVLLLALALIATLGPGLVNMMIALGLSSVPIFARVLRAETLSVRNRDYVIATQALGASHLRIIVAHILPNVLSTVIVLATTRFATAVLSESALSFLGLGIQPPTPSWGVMVADGRAYLERAPWIPVIPGLAIMIAVLGFNLFGDGLRDALDIRGRLP